MGCTGEFRTVDLDIHHWVGNILVWIISQIIYSITKSKIYSVRISELNSAFHNKLNFSSQPQIAKGRCYFVAKSC